MASLDTRSTLKAALIVLGFMVLLVYGYFQARDVIWGPTLDILSPQNGETVASTSPTIELRGVAKNISFITVDGLQIYTNEDGSFSRELLLSPGYTIITVEVRDKLKRSITKHVQLLVK